MHSITTGEWIELVNILTCLILIWLRPIILITTTIKLCWKKRIKKLGG